MIDIENNIYINFLIKNKCSYLIIDRILGNISLCINAI